MSNTLSALIHAASKTGKSTLSSTAPTPICVLDVEGSWRFIRTQGFHRLDRPIVKKDWNPLLGPPPRFDGTWNVCVVTVSDWQTLTQTYMWLVQAPHDFRSLIFDSVTEGQRKLKTNLRGLEQMRIQDWGDLLVQMDKLIRDMRDLVHIPRSTLEVVMFIAETELKDGKWRPAMQGQIGRAMPYWVDLVGYLYSEHIPDANGQTTVRQQRLLVGQNAQFEAGERVQGLLGDVVIDPDISRMMELIFGVPVTPAVLSTEPALVTDAQVEVPA